MTNNFSHKSPPPPDFTLDIPIFGRLYDFYKNLSDYLLLFPKPKRYTLGQNLDNITLEIIKQVVSAGYVARERKLPAVEKAIALTNVVKILLRLAKDTKTLDNKKYLILESNLQEIGRMLGGWKRSL